MTTADILSRVNGALNACTPENTPWAVRHALSTLAGDLETKLRQETAAKAGRGSAAKIIADMLRAVESSNRTALAYPWTDAEGRQCVIDGYQAYRLRDHLPLPERPEDAGEPVELEKLFPASLDGWKRLPMPSAQELRAFIAIERAKQAGRRKNDPQWDFGPHAPTVNARYLLNAATIFPGATEIRWNTLVSPLVIACDAGDALILPIRTEKTMEEPTDAERAAIEAENAQREQLHAEAANRSRAICQAHTDADAAWDAVKAAQAAQLEAMRQAEGGGAGRARIVAQYADACEAEAKARLRHHAASRVFDTAAAIEAGTFAEIVCKMYIRERIAA